MTVDGISQTGSTGSRYLGEGFRHEPDFRETKTALLPGSEAIAVTNGDSTVRLATRVPPPNLETVFDDPTEGEPGRDRMLIHGLWELLLAVGLAVGYLLLHGQQAAALSGDGLRALLLSGTVVGLLGMASALSLRAGVPNLAVGAVAAAAALYFGHHSGGLLQPMLVVVGVCALVGAAQGVVLVGLHVPGWAAGLGMAMVLLAWSAHQAAVTMTDGYDPLPHAYLWSGGFLAVSVIASVVGLAPTVRRALGRFRPVADPAYRRGLVAGLIALGATVGSTIVAGIAGVLSASAAGGASPSDGLELTALGLGAALLGGTSAYGRRGGVLGTALAAGVLAVTIKYSVATGHDWPAATFGAAAIGLGLAVTRLVERYGRPAGAAGAAEETDWASAVPLVLPQVAETSWSASPAWQAPTPAPTVDAGPGGLWGMDGAWGPAERR
jgi:ribose/xylose/arabinose/galactoside ABC-type transport system permease subunit